MRNEALLYPGTATPGLEPEEYQPVPPPRVAVVRELHEHVRIWNDNRFGTIRQPSKCLKDAFAFRIYGRLAERAAHHVHDHYGR